MTNLQTPKLPKISVIIPAYNEEAYIDATLQAVLALDYPNFEVIVVDNNSVDHTKEKVMRILEKMVVVNPKLILIEEPRAGVQFAREAGRRAATGELIANLDADCLPGSDWLLRAAKYFEGNGFRQNKIMGFGRPVAAVTGPYDYYDAPRSTRLSTDLGQKIVRNLMHKFFHTFFHRGGVIGGNVVMRADVLARMGGYDTSISFHGDDTDTGNKLSACGKVLFKNDLVVRSSARRYKRFGSTALTFRYMINYFWVLIFDRPFHNDLDRY